MGVNLTQYQIAIVKYGTNSGTPGPQQSVSRKHWKTEGNEVTKKVFAEIASVFRSIMIILAVAIGFSMALDVKDMCFLVTKATSSTNLEISSKKTGPSDFAEALRLILGVVSVVRILLICEGVEMNPGPEFQMCLLDTHESNFLLNTPATIFLKDGQLKGDVSLLRLKFKPIQRPIDTEINRLSGM